MGFVVEDGSGLPTANSYGSDADADTYFSDRGITAWTGDAATKQAALIRATDYIDSRFGMAFLGVPAVDGQALAFPRLYIPGVAEDEVPVKLQRACFEYALRALTATLAPDPVVGTSGVQTVKTKSKVGPIESEFAVVGGDNAVPMLVRPYPAADMLLKGLVRSSGRVIR